jgi:signal transduction histidine kinase
MLQNYVNEIRADSTSIVVPFTSAAFLVGGLVALAGAPLQTWGAIWSIWLLLGASFVALGLLRLLRRWEQPVLGLYLYLSAKLIAVTALMIQFWQPGSSLPMVFGYFIVISSMLIGLTAGFWVWGLSSGLSLLALYLGGQFSLQTIGSVAPAIGINFFLAVAAFLSAIDWKMAVESVSELQQKAQNRRDELFTIQEELKSTNARLNYLNTQLEEARRAAVAERDMRTRFMNNVSHELRTPLNAIVNFAYILEQGARGPVTEGQSDYLGRIEQAGRHLLAVLNDLLDLARIESGQFKLHFELTDLADICEEAMKNTSGLIIGQEITLVRDYPDEWPLVRVDKMRIKQALINLLGNAAKYTDEGEIRLRVRADADALLLSVIDTGMGIEAEYHEAIFQEFRQVDNTPARRRVGTGLGLPITRHLIEEHGGIITLESVPGQGSNFTISLPLPTADDDSSTPDTGTQS